MTRLVVILGFLVAFGAGLTAGLAWRHGDEAEEPGRGGPGSWIAAQLKLSPQQREQMDAIWSSAVREGGGRDGWQRKLELRRQRDEAIAALVPESSKADYQRVLDEYTAASDALDAQRRASFEQAVEKTRQILTPQQREQYEQIMARHREGGPRSSRSRDDHRPRPGDDRPSNPPPGEEH